MALNLFYERTRSISVSQDPQTAGHVDSTGGDVGRTFEVNISLRPLSSTSLPPSPQPSRRGITTYLKNISPPRTG